MSEQKIIYYDAGHGRLFPDKVGIPYKEYTTYETVRGKFFNHKKNGKLPIINGKEIPFHNDGIIYEGLINDAFAKLTCQEIKKIIPDVELVCLTHEWKDTPLQERVDKANVHFVNARRKGKVKAFGISFHSNASSSLEAVGQCVYTSIGETISDKIAKYFLSQLLFKFPKHEADKILSVRIDKKDLQGDYEEDFTIIKKTIMPYILYERGFFTNTKEAYDIMYNLSNQLLCAKAIAETAKAYFDNQV